MVGVDLGRGALDLNEARVRLGRSGIVAYRQGEGLLDPSDQVRLLSLADQIASHATDRRVTGVHRGTVIPLLDDSKYQRPQVVQQEAEEFMAILAGEDFLEHLATVQVDQFQLYLRRLQMNVLPPGGVVSVHQDDIDNRDYVATVSMMVNPSDGGGVFYLEMPSADPRHSQEVVEYPRERGDYLVLRADWPHGVTPVTGSKACVSLVAFYGTSDGINHGGPYDDLREVFF